MAKNVSFLALAVILLCGFSLKTKDVAVELPSNWSCKQNKGIWVCQETGRNRQKPAVILIQARKAKAKETQSYFRKILSQPRSIKGQNGRPLLSKVMSRQDRQISGQTWFEAVHLEGELDSYYTHYLASRRGHMAYLMTMSAHKSKWYQYKDIFYKVSSKVQVFAPQKSQRLASSPKISTTDLNNALNSTESENVLAEGKSRGLSRGSFRLLVFLGFLSLVGFTLYLLRS